MTEATDSTDTPARDFIRQIVADDLQQGAITPPVVTRFPPEPNGYLHIGHAKAICLDFGIADEFDGVCRLRFDDTNPSKEDTEYVDSIIRDVKWLTGRDELEVRYASDYFEQMYQWAELLIEKGLAYVDDQDGEAIRTNRGTIKSPGVNSPFRERSVEENLSLFRAMKAGECEPGSRVLRAKIDMAHENMLMRDPLMYRIQFDHHRTGDTWKIYPLYDWAHGLEDSIEGVTHSLCTLEFATHRPLYDWYIDQLPINPRPRQYEFNRLNLTHTVMSKRKLMELVDNKLVNGWDDPRMPTLCGLRRRGVPPIEAIKSFCAEVGYTKTESTNEWALLEYHVRQRLNDTFPALHGCAQAHFGGGGQLGRRPPRNRPGPLNPQNPEEGMRQLEAGKLLYIDADDFMEEPPKKFFRLRPGGEVRLRGLGFLRCDEVVKDAEGNIERLICAIDEDTLHGGDPCRRPQGQSHHPLGRRRHRPRRRSAFIRPPLHRRRPPQSRRRRRMDQKHRRQFLHHYHRKNPTVPSRSQGGRPSAV